ncbi:MAG TPA: hypothetical protein VGA00_09055 [Acidiferrobacterales bacterium]
MSVLKDFRLHAVAAAMLCTLAAPAAQAANWLMLQGTEKPSAAPTTNLWGFIQPQYSQTDGTPLAAGPWSGQNAVFNTILPDQKTDAQFHIQRARIGVRGQNFPLNSKVNYFILAEFGNNGITAGGGGAARVTDASVTLNYIPGARVRAGLFKYPGAEEGLQAIHVFDYVNFTNVTDQLLLERFFDRDGAATNAGASGGCPTAGGTADLCANKPNGPVGAFRDVGVQLFDAFAFGNFELSYAAMLGNGNGINRGDNDGDKDRYYYLSGEWVFGGEGPRREGVKFFAWAQDGTRRLVTGGTDAQADGTAGKFDRTRAGAGLTFRKGILRAAAEYVKADGMIFDGTDGGAVPGALSNAGTHYATFNIAPVDKADGYYIDLGVQAIRDRLELDLRYDTLNRRTDTAAAERQFTTVTLGAQWFFDRKNRLTVNYEFRDAEAPNLAGTAVPNVILGGTDDRITVQITSIF